MCGPIALAATTLAIGAASAAMQYNAAKSAAADQNAYANANANAAVDSAVRSYADVQARMTQEQDAASQEMEGVNREARQEAATARVAAGEAGVSGLSVDALLGDLYGSAARKRDSIATNRDWTVDQLQREQLGIKAQSQDRINAVRTVRGPSGLSLGLGIAQAAASAGGTYLAASNDEERTKAARSTKNPRL